jgi:dihydropteroate synthase
MNTKLTLTIEQSVIDSAKRYARTKERSLSDLVESYLRLLAKDVARNDIELTPTVKLLKGSFQVPENFDYKKELSDTLVDKYM